MEKWEAGNAEQSKKIIRVWFAGEYYTVWGQPAPLRIVMKPDEQLAEQLLDTKKSERPQEHVLKTPKKPTVKEKNKAQTQRKAIQHDLGK